jgi:hypothetical protein
MALGDLSRFRFAGYLITAAPELRRSDRRVPRFITAHRFAIENCVHSDEFDEPGRWDQFRLERPLRDVIPPRVRASALQAIHELTSESPEYGRPNVCLTLDAVRAVLAAARIPRDALMILEAGMPVNVAEEVLRRDASFLGTMEDGNRPLGLVGALRSNRFMSGLGEPLGVEPWYMRRRLSHSWRERVHIKPVLQRAFSRLNEFGLLSDIVDFELFVPGLHSPRALDRDASWVPLVLARHSVESILGDAPARVRRTFNEL